MALHSASGPRTSRQFSRESFTKKLFIVGLVMIADLSFNGLLLNFRFFISLLQKKRMAKLGKC